MVVGWLHAIQQISYSIPSSISYDSFTRFKTPLKERIGDRLYIVDPPLGNLRSIRFMRSIISSTMGMATSSIFCILFSFIKLLNRFMYLISRYTRHASSLWVVCSSSGRSVSYCSESLPTNEAASKVIEPAGSVFHYSMGAFSYRM